MARRSIQRWAWHSAFVIILEASTVQINEFLSFSNAKSYSSKPTEKNMFCVTALGKFLPSPA